MASALVATRKLFAANAGEGRRHDYDLPPLNPIARSTTKRYHIFLLPLSIELPMAIHIVSLTISLLRSISPFLLVVNGRDK